MELEIHLAELGRDLAGDELDELDQLDMDEIELEELCDRLGIDPGRIDEVQEYIEASGIVIADLNDPWRPGDGVTAVRRCLDCGKPAMPRKGARGPHPKRCADCAKARKKQQDAGGSKPRVYAECCLHWQAAGNGGQCPSCKDSRAVRRKPVLPVGAGEAEWLVSQLGPADGWHIEKAGPARGWLSDRGPDEGRTRPGIASADPFASEDDEAGRWLREHSRWYADGRIVSQYVGDEGHPAGGTGHGDDCAAA